MRKSNDLKVFSLMCGSSFFLSLLALFSKLGLTISSLSLIVFYRFFIPFLILVPFFLWCKTFNGIFSVPHLPMQILRGFAAFVSQTALFYYLTQGSLFNATMVYSSGPMFIPILAFIFFREKIKITTLLAIILGLIGVGCILKPDVGVFDKFSLFGLLAGFARACSQICFGKSATEEKVDDCLFYFYFTGAVFSTLPLIYEGIFSHLHILKMSEKALFGNALSTFYILGFSISTIATQGLLFTAYKYAKPSTIAPLFYLAIIFSALLDWIFYQNTPDLLDIIGAFLILIGSSVKQLFNNHKKRC